MLNLGPFAIITSLAVWSAPWGHPGAFLAPPITIIMTVVFSMLPGARSIAMLFPRSGRI